MNRRRRRLLLSARAQPVIEDFFDAALKIRTAYNARYTIAAAGSPPTITVQASGAVSVINGRATSNPQTLVASVQDGYSQIFGNGSTWIYGNRNTHAFTYAQGTSKLFRYTGSRFDFTCSDTVDVGGSEFSVRYKENGGNWMFGGNIARDHASWSGTGTRYVLIDFGTTADRIIELIAGELSPSSGFNFDVNGTLSTTTERNAAPRNMMFGDSFVFGQGATTALETMCRRTAERLGILDCPNHGRRANGFYEDPAGTTPHYSERTVGVLIPTRPTPEPLINGALDVVWINGTINDGGVSTANLQPIVETTLRNFRNAQPNAIIVFTAHPHNPDGRLGTTQQAALVDGFNAVLGNDPGAVLLNAVAEDWIPVGAIGSSIYFPATGDTTHPNDLGHDYFAQKISTGTLAFVDSIISQIPLYKDDALSLLFKDDGSSKLGKG